MSALQEFGHKTSAQQIQGYGRVLLGLPQEKKEEDFNGKNV